MKKLTHYVVTSGDYSDYSIDAVYSSKAKATRHVEIYGGTIEEYEDEKIAYPYRYEALIDLEGNFHEEGSNEYCYESLQFAKPTGWQKIEFYRDGRLITAWGVIARGETKEAAIKIAMEWWTEIKAREQGIA